MNNVFLKRLNQLQSDERQEKALKAKGNTVVLAGPGSGKTSVLSIKIVELLVNRIKKPQGLACLTYSREAAKEFQNRLEEFDIEGRENLFLGTLHSFCINEILNRFFHTYNSQYPDVIKIIPSKKREVLFDKVKKDLGYEDKKNVNLTNVNRARMSNRVKKGDINQNSDEIFEKVGSEYEKKIIESGYWDYEMIIIVSIKILKENKLALKILASRFPWILVDEYQDLGKPLHEMILLFHSVGINIFAVGDPDQSIYGFTGASPDFLNDLVGYEDFETIRLVNNYRSAQDIIDGSEIVLGMKRDYKSFNKEKHAKFYFVKCKKNLSDQNERIVNKIIPFFLRDVPLEEIAVLVADNNKARELSALCDLNDIPNYVSKRDFDRSNVIIWLENCAKWVLGQNQSFEELYMFWISIFSESEKDIILSYKHNIKERINLYEILRGSNQYSDSAYKWLNYLCNNLKLLEILNGLPYYPDEVDNLVTILKYFSYDENKDVNIDTLSNLGVIRNQITIATRHSSKGLEFEVVIMTGMEENNFPAWYKTKNNRDLEEENRLCFVCISRAKSHCVLLYSGCEDGKLYGQPHTYTRKPSRYIESLYEKYGKKKDTH